jgi:hypothetical protein
VAFPSLFKIVSFLLCLAILITCPAPKVPANPQTYIPKSEEEVDVLALVVAFEVKANGWKQNEFVCFSVNGLDPSPALVEALRHRKLKVRSSAEWTTKFNCGFELQLEYPQLDSSESTKVRSKVVDLREINTGLGDLALLQKDGEYLLKRENTKWSIIDYLPTGATSWHKVDAGPFSILAPSGWEFRQLAGVDSYVGEFAEDGLALTFDFGRYSSSLNEPKKPAYVINWESIGGFSAKVVSPRVPGHGITGVYFPDVGHSNRLCLWGKDLTPVQQELVLKIFETIRFGGPVPRHVNPPPPPGTRPSAR